MSITSLKTGGTGLSLALDNNYMEPIATATASSGTVVIFNDIPQTYKHLQIRCNVALSSGANDLRIRFNSDAGNNYADHYLRGNGSTTAAGADPDVDSIRYVAYMNSGTSQSNGIVVDILDYSNTGKFKTTRSLSGYDTNSAGWVMFSSGLWRDMTGINSITIFSSNNVFTTGTRFSLYGVKG